MSAFAVLLYLQIFLPSTCRFMLCFIGFPAFSEFSASQVYCPSCMFFCTVIMIKSLPWNALGISNDSFPLCICFPSFFQVIAGAGLRKNKQSARSY